MAPKSPAGITVSLFKLLRTDTCLIRWRRSTCTAPLPIISWEEILWVSVCDQSIISSFFRVLQTAKLLDDSIDS